MKFKGYRRTDGKVGIRNYILILPCSLCSSETARFIANQVLNAIYIPNQGGCALTKKDLEITLEILSGLAANPNVYGTVVVGNSCEAVQTNILVERIKAKTNKPLESVVIRDAGGTIKAVEIATQYAAKMARDAAKLYKEDTEITKLILGTECGGSDPTSGLAANPVIGNLSDRLVSLGATSILSETSELIGAEEVLARRCKSPELANKLLKVIKDFEMYFERLGEDLRDGNPTFGNKEGGLTTLEEKSLGCIHKGGHSTIMDVVGYGEEIKAKGLVVMDTPGQDIASITGMVAGGAQVVVFSTGRGTPTGYGIVPVIKITGNAETARLMADNIDFDTSQIISGIKSVEELGAALFDLFMEIVNGAQSKAESLGFNDMSMARACNFC